MNYTNVVSVKMWMHFIMAIKQLFFLAYYVWKCMYAKLCLTELKMWGQPTLAVLKTSPVLSCYRSGFHTYSDIRAPFRSWKSSQLFNSQQQHEGGAAKKTWSKLHFSLIKDSSIASTSCVYFLMLKSYFESRFQRCTTTLRLSRHYPAQKNENVWQTLASLYPASFLVQNLSKSMDMEQCR